MICAYAGEESPPVPLWPGRKTPPVLANDNLAFTTDYDLEMLHHFIKVVGPDMYSRRALDMQSIDIWSLAQSVPHVMHAVLAASALHLNTTSNKPLHALIETGHWVHASSSFRTALSKMTWHANPDPLITSCILLNLLSFAHVDVHAPATSRWPLAPDIPGADPLQWFSVQLGLSPLLTGLSARTKGESIWQPLFIASNHTCLYDERDGTVGIPSSWCQLFGITDTSRIEEHIYLRLVRRITLLRSIYDSLEFTHEVSGLPGCPDHDINAVKYLQSSHDAIVCTLDGDVMRREALVVLA
ncbi:uncharacterized protein Z518_00249 [Rhinocladiella mackenziei CBS 650.93]|uniref:Transcription factor domain-containing protein n=1 Tax=Rhinocladiella mackenziei CBS 650.93 TaxID=1442369 RepID=A0A0D2JID2_9EURO|nr:uncharacterized protein Z518_00249 [Rhinocladiella mackenziei CBS 650.93]KIX09170.1 hypothetical protein Z518_00249 [Rhinocladiella mackenziei CBS 650.93]